MSDSIDNLKNIQKQMEQDAENSQDVKDGNCTAEDEKKEPAYILYNNIIETSVQIMQLDPVVNIIKSLTETIGEDTAKSLVELFALTMTHSAHQAILIYDDMLKTELTKQFDHYCTQMNNIGGTVVGHDGALNEFNSRINDLTGAVSVLKKKIGEIETQLKKYEMQSQTHNKDSQV
jgi:hypothetical protein